MNRHYREESQGYFCMVGLERWVGWVERGGLQDDHFFLYVKVFSNGIYFYFAYEYVLFPDRGEPESYKEAVKTEDKEKCDCHAMISSHLAWLQSISYCVRHP